MLSDMLGACTPVYIGVSGVMGPLFCDLYRNADETPPGVISISRFVIRAEGAATLAAAPVAGLQGSPAGEIL